MSQGHKVQKTYFRCRVVGVSLHVYREAIQCLVVGTMITVRFSVISHGTLFVNRLKGLLPREQRRLIEVDEAFQCSDGPVLKSVQCPVSLYK